MEKLRFTKVRNVKAPTRGTSKSAGIDFYVPQFNKDDHESLVSDTVGTYLKPYLVVRPHSDILIPSGIIANIPSGYMLMGADKSGVVTSKSACYSVGRTPKSDAFTSAVIIGAKIVDEDYQGEIHIHLINTGDETIYIYPNMKIAQFILVPVCYADLEEVERLDDLFESTSERGTGCFGSTNKKD